MPLLNMLVFLVPGIHLLIYYIRPYYYTNLIFKKSLENPLKTPLLLNKTWILTKWVFKVGFVDKYGRKGRKRVVFTAMVGELGARGR